MAFVRMCLLVISSWALFAGAAQALTPIHDIIVVEAPTGERDLDRASIIAALEQVRPGGTVQFAVGTYLIGGAIKVSVPDITLAGNAAGTTLRGCDPAELINAPPLGDRCAGLDLRGARQTVRNLTFEHMSWASLQISGGRGEDGRLLPTRSGGHLIESNTFRDSDSFNVISDAAEPILIRGNTFLNTYHAVAIQGRNVQFLDNVIRTLEPARIPYGRADIAIGIAQFSLNGPVCADNLIAGNSIEGHSDGIAIGVFGPGTSCRGNVVRDNTIAVRRVTVTEQERGMLGDGAGTTAVGVAVRLLNFPAMCQAMPSGLETWMCPPGASGPDAVLADNIIEGNRVTGGEGIAIEILHAKRNRILNNTISGIARLDRFPGDIFRRPPHYYEGNGSGIWLSPGSDENEISGNVFEDLGADAIVVEGDNNVVETWDTVRDLGSGNRVGAPPNPEIDTRLVEVDGRSMRVQTAGWHYRQRGQPIVVFENGAGTPIEAWEPVLGAVAEFAPVIAYDRSGLGQSVWDEQPPTPEHVNRKLRSLLAALGAEPPYVLVGFSWGGPLIEHFAAAWPDEVAGMVFIDAPDILVRKELEIAAFDEIGAGEAGRRAWYGAFDDFIAQAPPAIRAEVAVIRELLEAGSPALAAAARPDVPVVVLVAGRFEAQPVPEPFPFDERAWFEALRGLTARHLTESFLSAPEATVVIATHAGHYVHGDDPALVVEAIRRVSFPDVARQLRGTADRYGAPAAVEQYRQIKRRYPTERFQEHLLNRLGYQLLSEGEVDAAIAFFELNVREYPQAANPHDSLGDAYSAAGRFDDARASYRNAVERAEAAGDLRLPLFQSKLERAEQQRIENR